MLDNRIQEIRNLLENIDEELENKYDLEQIYPNCLISLKTAFEILDENLDILENLEETELKNLVWYRIENFQYLNDSSNYDILYLSTFFQKANSLINKIIASLNTMISNPTNQGYLVPFINAVLHLNTIIKDFRLDLDVKKLAGVRSKYNEAKKLLIEASEIVDNLKNKENEINELNEEIEKLISQKRIIENLYEKSEELSASLSSIDENLEDFEHKKEEVDLLYNKVEDIKTKIEKLNDDFQKRVGEYEATIKSFEEEKKNTLSEFQKEIENKREELKKYEEQQKKKIDELMKKAQNTLEWTTASGLKTAFSEKAKSLKWESRGYFALFLGLSFITFFISISVIFAPEVIFNLIFSILHIDLPQNFRVSHVEDSNVLLFLTRTGIIGTSIFFTWLMWKTYIKTKLLYEEYKKKEILAQNLMIGANTLIENFGFSKEEATKEYIKPSLQKILEDSIEKIYNLYSKQIEKESPINIIEKIRKAKSIKRKKTEKKGNE